MKKGNHIMPEDGGMSDEEIDRIRSLAIGESMPLGDPEAGLTVVIESKSAEKIGWGRARYRRVIGLTDDERKAVIDGAIVWFRYKPWHHTQSGYKVVTYSAYGYDSREPTPDELHRITADIPNGVGEGQGPEAHLETLDDGPEEMFSYA